MNDRLQRIALAIGAVVVSAGVLFYLSTASMGEELVYYKSPTELRAMGSKAQNATIRMMGMVEEGTVDWKPESQQLAFRVWDGETSLAVVGQGAPPQMFREGIGVVIEGKLGPDGVFRSNTVMVKHSNEYQAPEEGEMPDEVYKMLREEDAS